MSNRINKKGLSQIVATFVILLLAIAAIGVISITLTNISKKAMLSPQLSCFELKTKQPLTIERACYNQQTHDTEITLNRKIDSNIDAIELILKTENSISKWQIGNLCTTSIILNKGETKIYYINSEENPKEISINIDKCILQTEKIISC